MTGNNHPHRPASDDAGRLVIRRAPGAPARPGPFAARHEGLDGEDAGLEEGPRADWRDWAPLLAWLATLVIAVLAFHALGRTPMASPPVHDLGAWWDWAQGRTADELAFNVLRILGVGLSWYLVGVTSIGALARILRAGGLVRIADRITVRPVRQLLQASLGIVLAAGATTALPGTAPSPAAPSAAVVVDTGTGGQTQDGPIRPVVPGAIGQLVDLGTVESPATATLRTEASLREGVPVGHDGWSHLLRTHELAGQEVLERPANSLDGPQTAGDEGLLAPEGELTWVVESGDHFWSIAQQVLAQDGPGATIGEDDVMQYWQRLVDANRHRLVDPANADLLLPGQVLVLPGGAA